MLKYGKSELARTGFIGVVVIILLIAVGLQPERLISWATAARYQALFVEAGGLNDLVGVVDAGEVSFSSSMATLISLPLLNQRTGLSLIWICVNPGTEAPTTTMNSPRSR